MTNASLSRSLLLWASFLVGCGALEPSAAERGPASWARIGETLDARMAAGTYKEVTGVLVAADGQRVLERYFGAGGPEVLNNTRSATKSLTAMAVGAAIDDGALASVDVPVMSFFEAERPVRFGSDLKDQITVRDLLTMSSALDCNDSEWSSPGNEEHMHPARRWTFFVLDLPTKADYVRNEQGLGPFSYCTAGSFLLGQVIERAVGEPVDRYTERRLLKPLGIDQVSWYRSPSKEVQTGGGTELTGNALLALAELVRKDGRHGEKQLLSAAWIDEMLTEHLRANAEQGYGYQWWQRNFRCGAGTASGWYMAGNGGNKVVVFDDLDLSVVITARLYGTRGMHEQTTRLLEDEILAQLPACAGPKGVGQPRSPAH